MATLLSLRHVHLMSHEPHTTFIAITSGLLLVVGSSTFASPALDAGAVSRQLEARDNPNQSLPPVQKSPSTPTSSPKTGSESIHVQRFSFIGNELLSNDVLIDITKEFVGRAQRFTDITLAARKISDEYRRLGWLAYVYVPPQDVTEGTVTIKIIEASFAGTHIEAGSSNPTTNERVLGFFGHQLADKSPVSLAGIDRALLLADDLPDVSVSAALSAGDAEGQTKLAVNIADQDKWNFGALLDNHGNQATGQRRSTVYAIASGALGLSERVTVQARHSKGSTQVSAAVSLPVGLQGWQADMRATHLQYRLIDSQFSALNAQGRSSTIEVGAKYPFIRSRTHNLFFNANAGYREFLNKANQETQSSYVTRSVSAGLSGNFYDSYGGGANSGGSISISDGNVRTRLGEQRPGIQKINYSLYRSQRIFSRANFDFLYFGQHSTGDLDSSERFYIGGIDGVRAFSGDQGGGSRGDVAKLDLSVRITHGVMAKVFHDWGRVRPVGSTGWLECQGSGLGFEWDNTKNSVKVHISIAKGTSLCALPTTTIDQGAHSPKTQAWVQIGASF